MHQHRLNQSRTKGREGVVADQVRRISKVGRINMQLWRRQISRISAITNLLQCFWPNSRTISTTTLMSRWPDQQSRLRQGKVAVNHVRLTSLQNHIISPALLTASSTMQQLTLTIAQSSTSTSVRWQLTIIVRNRPPRLIQQQTRDCKLLVRQSQNS